MTAVSHAQDVLIEFRACGLPWQIRVAPGSNGAISKLRELGLSKAAPELEFAVLTSSPAKLIESLKAFLWAGAGFGLAETAFGKLDGNDARVLTAAADALARYERGCRHG